MAIRKRADGEETIYEMWPGLWKAEISLGFDAAGKRIRKAVYGKT